MEVFVGYELKWGIWLPGLTNEGMTFERIQAFHVSVVLDYYHGENPRVHQVLDPIRYGLYVEQHSHVFVFTLQWVYSLQVDSVDSDGEFHYWKDLTCKMFFFGEFLGQLYIHGQLCNLRSTWIKYWIIDNVRRIWTVIKNEKCIDYRNSPDFSGLKSRYLFLWLTHGLI